MTTTEEIPDYLGGYVSGGHGDEATWYPDLWRWLVQGDLAVKSVLDIGCGEGHSTQFFADLGVSVLGLEGTPQANPLIEQVDFTKGPWVPSDSARFSLGWCCEFVEHVEEQYRDNFGAAFVECDVVLMTHADPGQGGHHHVNCQPIEYWANWMGRLGFEIDLQLTRKTRIIASLNESPWNHFKRAGTAYRKVS